MYVVWEEFTLLTRDLKSNIFNFTHLYAVWEEFTFPIRGLISNTLPTKSWGWQIGPKMSFEECGLPWTSDSVGEKKKSIKNK